MTGPGIGFTDVAPAAGVDFSAGHNPLFSTEKWRLEKFGIARYAAAGVSAVDYDADGWADLFFADGASFRLYRNDTLRAGSLSFTDVTAEAGLPLDLPGTHVGLFADLDNDGDQDAVWGVKSSWEHFDGKQFDGVVRIDLEQPPQRLTFVGNERFGLRDLRLETR